MMRSLPFLALLLAAAWGPRVSLAAKPPLIISSDIDGDDLEAVAYLVKSNVYDIKLIAVDTNAWTDEMFGVPNMLTLLRELGCGDTTSARGVAYGDREPLIDWGGPGDLAAARVKVNTLMTKCLKLAPPTQLPSTETAARQIVRTLQKSQQKVDILLLGSWTNLGMAVDLDPTIASKIKTVYISGGYFDPLNSSKYKPNVETTWKYTWKNKATGWNLFLDGLAVHKVLKSGIKRFVAMPSPTQDQLPYSSQYLEAFLANNTLNPSKVVLDLDRNFVSCTNQTEADISYWDESAAVMMEQDRLGVSADKTICTQWKTWNVSMYLWPDNKYGMLINDNVTGTPVQACMAVSKPAFFQAFWSTLSSTNKPNCPNPIAAPSAKASTKAAATVTQAKVATADRVVAGDAPTAEPQQEKDDLSLQPAAATTSFTAWYANNSYQTFLGVMVVILVVFQLGTCVVVMVQGRKARKDRAAAEAEAVAAATKLGAAPAGIAAENAV